MGEFKTDEDFIRSITEFDDENYLKVDNDSLILFTVDYLKSNNVEPTFDKIVVAAFKLFPNKLSLIGFPEYPDGKRIHDCLFHCTYKTKKWLSGNAKSGYTITKKGEYYLDQSKKILEGKIELRKSYDVVPKRKEATFISLLKKSEAYKKYKNNEKKDVTKSDILEALKVPSSSEKLLEYHLKRYLEYAHRINDKSVIEFLEFIKKEVR